MNRMVSSTFQRVIYALATRHNNTFAGYNQIGRIKGIVHIGCFVHVQRKFMDIVKTKKKNRGGKAPSRGLADETIDIISNLYKIEKYAKQDRLLCYEVYELRQRESRQILDNFKLWLDANQPLSPPEGLL